MITTSAEFGEQMGSNARKLCARFLLNGTEVEGEVKEVKVNKGVCGDSAFSVGNVYSSYITVTIDDCPTLLENQELELQIGVELTDGTVEYCTVGFYTASDVATSVGSTTFTGLGRLSSKCGSGYWSDNGWPQTVQSALDEIAEQTGVGIDTSACDSTALALDIETSMDGLLHREALMYIAGLLGGFATESSDGGIVIQPFTSEITAEMDADRTTEMFEFSDYDFTVTGVEVIVSESGTDDDGNEVEGVSYTHGTPNLTLSNPYMTQALFDIMAPQITGFTYRPGTVPIDMGDIRLEAGDVISAVDAEGVSHTVACLLVEHTFDGGLMTTITAPGESETEQEASFTGSLAAAVQKTATELLVAKKVTATSLEAVKASIAELDAKAITTEYLTTNYLTANDIKTTYLTATDIAAKYAEIDFANVSTANVGKLLANVGLITDLVVTDGYITGALSGVTINADVITAGTLSVDRLLLTGEDGIIYKINATSSGLTETELEAEEYQKYINGSCIVANSVTAAQINVTDLFAQNITATGSITGLALYSTDGKFSLDANGLAAVSGNVGGFTIGKKALYNGTTSLSSDESGVYLGIDGIKTASSDGSVIHTTYYSEYRYSDGNSYVRISGSGLTIYSIDIDNGIDFRDEDEVPIIRLRAFTAGAGGLEIYNQSYELMGIDGGSTEGSADVTVYGALNVKSTLSVAGDIYNSGGAFKATNGHGFYSRNTSGSLVNIGYMDTSNNVKLGNSSYPTYLYGSSIYANSFPIPEIQRGTVSVSVTASETNTSFSVTFSKTFSGTPAIVITPSHDSSTTSTEYKIRTRSSTGFSGYIRTTGLGTYTINWIAMY